MTQFVQYEVSAISCAKWTGASTREILMDAGLPGTMEEIEKMGIKFIVYEVSVWYQT